MFKERLQEILEFTKSESPYRKANKGWINKDVFLEIGNSSSTLSKQKEAAEVKFFWPPIQRLIFNLLLILIIASLIVLTTLKGSELNFNLGSFIISFKTNLFQLEAQKPNLFIEEDQIISSNLNSESEDNFSSEQINISDKELLDKEDLLKVEDSVLKDQLPELQEQLPEELVEKNDITIKNVKKSKSNFF